MANQDGPHKTYFNSGRISGESFIKNGEYDGLEGPFKVYYKSGKLYKDGFYKDGKYEGPCRKYDENGKLQE